jgi:SAM-dependent methyltransferase
MTAQQPRVETDPEAIWTPALARGLIRDEALRGMRYRDGYTDLLGAAARDRSRRNRNRRPHWMFAYGTGATVAHLRGEPRVLDVACGRGDLTRSIANRLCGNGFVIGLDDSASMMERAARINNHSRATYIRAEPGCLPFDDDTFDVVCCFAGLHRMRDPAGVLSEMVRVLAPDGFVAVVASCRREFPLLRRTLESAARICHAKLFDRTTITAALTTAGLTDVEQQCHGLSQFVTARQPRPVSPLDALRRRRETAR